MITLAVEENREPDNTICEGMSFAVVKYRCTKRAAEISGIGSFRFGDCVGFLSRDFKVTAFFYGGRLYGLESQLFDFIFEPVP